MVENPREHQIGLQAVAAVCSILADAHQIYEEISKDYGEDILVKTSHAGQVDASRLWIQVKGTENIDRYRLKKWKKKKGEFSYPISFDHAIRWIRSVDLVIFVLWDVKEGVGWYAVPRRQVDDWKGMKCGNKDTRLYFGPYDHDFDDEPRPFSKGVFDVDAVKRLAWESRFEHVRLLLLDANEAAREAGRLSPSGEPDSNRQTLILAEFLKLLGMIDPEVEPGQIKINQETRALCTAIVEERRGRLPGEDLHEKVLAAALLTVQERVREFDPLLGLPKYTLEVATAALGRTLILGHQAYREQEAEAGSPSS
jgi:hypothetical protein